MVVNIAYQTVFTTDLFYNAYQNWRRRPAIQKTWVNFKTYFALTYQEPVDSQGTTCTGGFHAVNIVEIHQDTSEALANLAKATTSDRKAVKKITETNNQLVAQISQSSNLLSQSKSDIVALRKHMLEIKTGCDRSGQIRPNKYYLWLHSYQSTDRHTFLNCNNPKYGHKREATVANTMGGVTRGKPIE